MVLKMDQSNSFLFALPMHSLRDMLPSHFPAWRLFTRYQKLNWAVHANNMGTKLTEELYHTCPITGMSIGLLVVSIKTLAPFRTATWQAEVLLITQPQKPSPAKKNGVIICYIIVRLIQTACDTRILRLALPMYFSIKQWHFLPLWTVDVACGGLSSMLQH